MTVAAVQTPPAVAVARQPRDLQRTAQLGLATIWLLDAVLQLQPFMFTSGANGFSAMIGGTASGNPAWVAHTITWNATIVDHHPALNTAFALVQFLIAFGIVGRRTCKAALGLSIVWAIGVWWFGEGLGGVFAGNGTPFAGGPGAVLFYGLLAVLLWPASGPDIPFVAARSVGAAAARAVWAALWGVLAVLSVVGSGLSSKALNGIVTGMASGQPGWLVHLDRYSATLLLHHGTALPISLCVFCAVVAISVYLPVPWAKVAIVLVIAAFGFIWVAVQNFGGIVAGGATDPNSGLLVILLALVYWPLTQVRSQPGYGLEADNRPRLVDIRGGCGS
ncbi:MAG TPA: hypothetical protein VMF65_23030 [Acidimicrobiales bacterium]|nr:hypothetical protein [Acidimicrobiales bacterium]